MPHDGTSRRAVVAGALAGAVAIGFGASRVSAAPRPGAGGVTLTALRSPDGCDGVGEITGVNRSGQVVGSGLIGGKSFGPVLWSGGRVSAPLGPGGVRPLEIVGIGDLGQYAGTYDDADGRRTALLWTGGTPQPIRIGALHTRAALMDASGRVLVQARSGLPDGGDGWTYDRMFLYARGRAIPVLPPDGGPWDTVRPLALNRRGAVLAAAVAPGTWQSRPFLWQAGRAIWLTDVGGGGMDVRPVALNDRGQVAGYVMSYGAGLRRHAFRWQAGTYELSPLPLGTASGEVRVDGLQAINMRGDVVGSCYDDESGIDVPVLWSGDTVTVLPVPEGATLGQALAVNDRGDACGTYLPDTIGYFRPCMWRGGRRIDLPMPEGHTAAEAMRLDNDGVIYNSAVLSTAGAASGAVTSGGSSSGGSAGGGSTGGGGVSGGASSVGATTGEPGCSAALYGAVRWAVPS